MRVRDNEFGPVDMTAWKYPGECDRCGKEIRHGFANLCIVLCGTCYARFLRRSEAAELGWQRRRERSA